MKKRLFSVLGICVLSAALFMGCGGKSYLDGTYTGQSSVYESDEDDDNGNGYGVVTITIENGQITGCIYDTYEPDGTLKDSDYGLQDGEVSNRDYYNKAQKAVAACEKYAESLVETKDIDEVDAVSGATINYNNFKEAVKDALKQAQ